MTGKRIKVLLVLMLTAVLFFSATASLGVQATEAKTAYVDIGSGVLNVRSGAGTNHKKIGTLENKTKLTVYSQTKNGWSEIKLNKKKGYVLTKYLRFYHTMSNTDAKAITDQAIGTMSKLKYDKTYTKKEIHSILSPSYTTAYIDNLIKNDMHPTGKKDKQKNALYEWIPTDFPVYRIWGFDWKSKNNPKPPSIEYYTKSGVQYLKVSQVSKDDMYDYNKQLSLIKQDSKSNWKIYNYKW
ncbi:SH3 domain-containing protein [Metabacillus fastidiosus]|uniref:SH3 domain-containing protein n=1 Tax=Metabacillus fastidiosus TaxID=1458 RepID=UPI003D26ED3D